MKLTPWFDGEAQSPVRVGVYELCAKYGWHRGVMQPDSFGIYAYWDGERWCKWQHSIEDACKDLRYSIHLDQCWWRGVMNAETS